MGFPLVGKPHPSGYESGVRRVYHAVCDYIGILKVPH